MSQCFVACVSSCPGASGYTEARQHPSRHRIEPEFGPSPTASASSVSTRPRDLRLASQSPRAESHMRLPAPSEPIRLASQCPNDLKLAGRPENSNPFLLMHRFAADLHHLGPVFRGVRTRPHDTPGPVRVRPPHSRSGIAPSGRAWQDFPSELQSSSHPRG
jgi:hypothetical protein